MIELWSNSMTDSDILEQVHGALTVSVNKCYSLIWLQVKIIMVEILDKTEYVINYLHDLIGIKSPLEDNPDTRMANNVFSK